MPCRPPQWKKASPPGCGASHGRCAHRCGSRSMSRCRRSARPAAMWSANPPAFAPSCWSKLSPIERPFCERLGIPFVYDPGPGILSMQAIADPPAYTRARAAVRYDDVARALVHALKYGDRLDLAPTMGNWMARAGKELLADADAIVPVPLHWRRTWARRFNQSAALSKIISRTLRHSGRFRGPEAGQGDAAAGRAVEVRTRVECAGRVPRRACRQNRRIPAPDRAGRRRADIGGDGR